MCQRAVLFGHPLTQTSIATRCPRCGLLLHCTAFLPLLFVADARSRRACGCYQLNKSRCVRACVIDACVVSGHTQEPAYVHKRHICVLRHPLPAQGLAALFWAASVHGAGLHANPPIHLSIPSAASPPLAFLFGNGAETISLNIVTKVIITLSLLTSLIRINKFRPNGTRCMSHWCNLLLPCTEHTWTAAVRRTHCIP